MSFIQSLAYNAKISHVTVDGTNYTLAAGTSDVNSGVVDLAGYEGVTWIVLLSTMAASSTVDVKVQQGAASNLSDAADLAGTAFTQAGASDDDEIIVIEVKDPQERYQRLAFTRGDGGNSTINGVLAILWGAQKVPITQDVTAGQHVAQPEVHIGPAEGTA